SDAGDPGDADGAGGAPGEAGAACGARGSGGAGDAGAAPAVISPVTIATLAPDGRRADREQLAAKNTAGEVIPRCLRYDEDSKPKDTGRNVTGRRGKRGRKDNPVPESDLPDEPPF
ncbi:MAG TPA: hypothetical protein VGN54_10900, partial [Mycobacteriales bacterium]|nr:hypothetical protein [Mycobacteriales bacterium]